MVDIKYKRRKKKSCGKKTYAYHFLGSSRWSTSFCMLQNTIWIFLQDINQDVSMPRIDNVISVQMLSCLLSYATSHFKNPTHSQKIAFGADDIGFLKFPAVQVTVLGT